MCNKNHNDGDSSDNHTGTQIIRKNKGRTRLYHTKDQQPDYCPQLLYLFSHLDNKYRHINNNRYLGYLCRLKLNTQL